MMNQTALPSLTVNPSNVLPSLPPSLPFSAPPPLPPLSSPFSLSTFHPRADAPSECRSRPWSTNTISPCDPFIVARTSQEVNARPAGTDGEKTRRRRRRRMAGTGLRRHGQPHSEPRRATVGGHGNIYCADRQGSSTTTGTLIIIIIIAPLVFGPGGSLGSPVPRGERTLEGSLVDVERNGLQNTQAQYRTSLKPCGGSFGHAAYLNRYRRGSEVLWTRRRPPSLPSR